MSKNQSQLTLGENADGTDFGHGQDPRANRIKKCFALLIDGMDAMRTASGNPEIKRMASGAITKAQTAQMRAVKALTGSAR